MLEKSKRSLKYMRGKQIILFILTVACSLVAIEIGLRVFSYPYIGCKEIDDTPEYQIGQYDPLLGWSYVPSRSIVFLDKKTYTFAKDGYRAGAIEDTVDFSKPRILIVGDSFLFGHGLDFEETFGAKLESKLENRFEILNFAVQGYGLDQAYLRLKQLMPVYKPTIVIVDIHEDQDYRNSNRDRRFFFPCSRITGTKPLFMIKDKKLVLVDMPERYEVYDNPRIQLVLRRFEDAMRQWSRGKVELSERIYREMKQYVEGKGATLLEINYQLAIRDYQIDPRTSSASAIVVDYGKEYLVDDVHPNASGTARMVDEFLERFGTQFK